jgi:hypothetical protein
MDSKLGGSSNSVCTARFCILLLASACRAMQLRFQTLKRLQRHDVRSNLWSFTFAHNLEQGRSRGQNYVRQKGFWLPLRYHNDSEQGRSGGKLRKPAAGGLPSPALPCGAQSRSASPSGARESGPEPVCFSPASHAQ